jgi:hypothetical protein
MPMHEVLEFGCSAGGGCAKERHITTSDRDYN